MYHRTPGLTTSCETADSPTPDIAPLPTELTQPTEPTAAELTLMERAYETLLTLQQEIVPINDPIDLGERLGGISDIPETLPDLERTLRSWGHPGFLGDQCGFKSEF